MKNADKVIAFGAPRPGEPTRERSTYPAFSRKPTAVRGEQNTTAMRALSRTRALSLSHPRCWQLEEKFPGEFLESSGDILLNHVVEDSGLDPPAFAGNHRQENSTTWRIPGTFRRHTSQPRGQGIGRYLTRVITKYFVYNDRPRMTPTHPT